MYFWVCGSDIAPGSVVRAGNWGRIVRQLGLQHNLAGRELLWESARIDVDSRLPSRYTSAFVSLDEAAAHRFRQEACVFARIYEVEPTQDNAVAFTADMTWVDCVLNDFANVDPPDRLVLQRGYANNYWTGAAKAPGSEKWEVLIASDLRIKTLIL